jgi:hypothetical protein
MSQADILAKVEAVIPTARRFLRGQIEQRLTALTTKESGSRYVNVYKRKGVYCLPYESRTAIRDSIVEDENLKLSLTQRFRERLLEQGGAELDASVLETIPSLLHKTLEIVFERQGYDAARHFLEDNGEQLSPKPIVQIAEEVLAESSISPALHAKVGTLMKGVMRDVFYRSNATERTYCARLARTDIMLFTIKNTPEIIEHFNSMSKNFVLYVGADIVVRAISEFYLRPEDQMTVNALKIIRQAGSKIILSAAVLEEVHSHIHASDREFDNTYAEVDHIVDRDLASESDRILIRAYYYAKLDKTLSNRPGSWGAYLNNFLTRSRMTGPTSPESMKSLRDTLVARFGLEFEDRESMESGVDQTDLQKLTDTILHLRRDQRRAQEELRARNDALHILHVLRRRKTDEKGTSSPFGYRTWWLTQETKSGLAMAMAFPAIRGIRTIMRPEFLINYIAYNPTTNEVKQSLATIFPSLLGIRLGTRMEKANFEKVMQRIREVHSTDPARALAMIVEHSDALISQNLREFVTKYASPI